MRHSSLVMLLSMLCAGSALAQGNYPSKPIRLLVPYAPGGGSDLVIRPVTQKLTEVLKTQILLDNRGGGSGVIATEAAARAPADGYTLLLGNIGPLAINVPMHKALAYDPRRDFSPVSLLAVSTTVVVVHPSVPAKTLPELIALAKAQPGKLNFGSAGVGSIHQLTMAIFQMDTGVNMVHVPYKGGSPMVAAVMAGGRPGAMPASQRNMRGESRCDDTSMVPGDGTRFGRRRTKAAGWTRSGGACAPRAAGRPAGARRARRRIATGIPAPSPPPPRSGGWRRNPGGRIAAPPRPPPSSARARAGIPDARRARGARNNRARPARHWARRDRRER